MKTLLEIIQHIWPRSKWEIVEQFDVYLESNPARPCERKYILRDQFGNMKKFIA